MNNCLNMRYLATTLIATTILGCSSTSSVPEGDQLFTGLTKIKYNNYENCDQAIIAQTEVEAALATAPNGAIFGSSYYRTPFQFRLWLYNAFAKDESKFGTWMRTSFGKAPVLMSWVNPELRASVAREALRSHGYFRSDVSYNVVKQRNPKKAKIGYNVNMGHLFTIDTISYNGFFGDAGTLIKASTADAVVKGGDPFDVSALEDERNRISTLLRNNGYFYYQPSFASYLADTISLPGKVKLKFQLNDSINHRGLHKWYMGNVTINFRKKFMEELKDSFHHRRFTAHFNGRRPPIRPRVILRDLKLRPRQPYSYQNYTESANKLSSMGLFSMVDFTFTPRDSSLNCDTLDLTLSCVFDKPYQFYIETNATGKTTGRVGPELVLGMTKMNAFHGGEKLDINLHGSYEWQTGHEAKGAHGKLNSYEYGGDITLELPRLLLPFMRRHRFHSTPTTIIRASRNTLNRADYFKRNVVSGELTYTFQTSATSLHEFSPLTLEYEHMVSTTDTFRAIMKQNPYLLISMQDQFIPKMSYTYTYTSPKNNINPIYWRTTVSEAANILSTAYMAFGNKWSTRDKEMFKNPYAQFFKVESDFRKTWALTEHSQLVGHIAAGIIYSYGNSVRAPYSEQFFVGGANSIRAFTVRAIGPGSFHTDEPQLSYMDQTGDIKFLANMEYRTRLFGDLHGAVFLDAGNVWAIRDDYRQNSKFKLNNLPDELAVGTGIGLRYDLEFFVLRVDWGIGLHLPYTTNRNGWYNIPNFKDGQSLHLAIGYPF